MTTPHATAPVRPEGSCTYTERPGQVASVIIQLRLRTAADAFQARLHAAVEGASLQPGCRDRVIEALRAHAILPHGDVPEPVSDAVLTERVMEEGGVPASVREAAARVLAERGYKPGYYRADSGLTVALSHAADASWRPSA